MIKMFKNIGPGPLIAAAFIGPGTVTVCSMAGANFGYQLIWAVVISIFGTIILQSMSARLGLITQKGLAENIKFVMDTPFKKRAAVVLIISAILIGNAAYEAGNISGGGIGFSRLFGSHQFSLLGMTVKISSVLIGVFAFFLLYLSKYKTLEKIFISLVVLMSISYISAAVLLQPNIGELLSGSFVPKAPKGSLITIIALVGTTIVPYNLFLHASLVNEKWTEPSKLKYAIRDTVIAMILGGLVSIAIIITSSEIQELQPLDSNLLLSSLDSVYGDVASLLMALGLFAAGVTSAITAPLAAAYVARELFGWPRDNGDRRFRGVWMLILVLGTLISTFGNSPLVIIKFAQFANGLLLPIVAFFLLYVMNSKHIQKQYRNTKFQNISGGLIMLFTLLLGVKAVFKVIEWLIG